MNDPIPVACGSTVAWAEGRDKITPKPDGSFELILWHLGYVVVGDIDSEARSILSAKQGYAGYTSGRGPVDAGDTLNWYVYPDGRITSYRGHFIGGFKSPPISIEEASAMGFDTFSGWQHKNDHLYRYESYGWPKEK